MIKRLVMCGGILLYAACTTEPASRAVGPDGVNSGASIASGEAYLPYGVAVPVGQVLDRPPEPYNPQRHGAPLPSTIGTYIVQTSGEGVPMRAAQRGAPPKPVLLQSGGSYRGFYLFANTKNWYGVHSIKDVSLNLNLPTPGPAGAIWLYAPTTLPPAGSCIEGVVRHERTIFVPTTIHYLGWYDWCTTSNQWHLAPMDASFQSKYVRTYNGKPTLAISIVSPVSGPATDCWYANLYNYNVGGWEGVFQSCGTSMSGWGNTGWTMWEAYNMGEVGCPVLPSIRSMEIQLANPSTSQWVSFKNYPNDYAQLGPTGDCWYGGPYSFVSPVPGLASNTWRANTPSP